MSAELPAGLAELLELLSMLERSERIDTLISIAERFRDVPPEIAERPFSDEHKVPACESEAYAWARPRTDGTLDFVFAVENPQGISAQAMAVILSEHLSGETLERVAAVPGDVVYDIFGRELSMGKSMGLMGMVSMVTASAKRALGGPMLAAAGASTLPANS
ncbi:MAG: SufE family protein [Acidobacteriota bacterium]